MSYSRHDRDNGPHDLGGRPSPTVAIDRAEKPLQYWEFCIHALLVVLSTKNPPLITTDELRRGVEGLEPWAYESWGYYDKWSASMAKLLIERGVVSETELDTEMFGAADEAAVDCSPYPSGTVVQVRSEDQRSRWRKPHLRCPGYIFGQVGRILKYVGKFEDPFFLAFRGAGPQQHLYTVAFRHSDIWSTPEGGPASDDQVTLDIYHSWLSPVNPPPLPHEHDVGHAMHTHGDCGLTEECTSGSEHHHSHFHQVHDQVTEDLGTRPEKRQKLGPLSVCSSDSADHFHDHQHDARGVTEQVAIDREGAPTPGQEVGEALLRLLYSKNIITPSAIASAVEKLDMAGKVMAGADLVVKSWLDPEFKKRLLTNAPAAALELGVVTSNPNAPTILQVVENTDSVHNVIVCTLCSCYPVGLLGLSPPWYKSRSYRSRVVKEPRTVLREFGVVLPDDVSVRVHDSTADCRFLVLPRRPEHTSGWNSDQLRAIVTRDSMIGVAIL